MRRKFTALLPNLLTPWLIIPTGVITLVILSGCPTASVKDVMGELFDKPVLESITPSSGPEAGGTKVILRGHNFNPDAGVVIGDATAIDVTCLNRGLMEAYTPAHEPGLVDVVIINSAGQKTVFENAFEFIAVEPPPERPVTVSEIVPNKAPSNVDTIVMIYGSNFEEGMVIVFGALVCENVSIINETTLSVQVPSQAPGKVDVVIRGADGKSVILPDAFEYLPEVPADIPGAPRVVGAVSTSNTSVRVTFSEPVEEGATDPTNYSIVQTNVHSEAGVLLVTSATLHANKTIVNLGTYSQNEVVYTLTVANVRDLDGNLMAPPGIMVNPTQAEFAGTPPTNNEFTDSDNDGLPDHVEQRGWVVQVRMSNGAIIEREVTSNPNSMDTDQDGINDRVEHQRGMDPRSADTDGDKVSDRDEIQTWFSDATDQDTDHDGLADITDIFFKTSPILADTDGDGFDDRRELFEMNRNPRLADLPQPQLIIGDMRLQIDERYSYVDHAGKTITEASSSSSKLSQSQSTGFRQSDTSSNETFVEGGFGGEIGYNKGFVGLFKPFLKAGGKWGSTSQVTQESAASSQQAFENSLAKGSTFTTTATVAREIYGASVETSLILGNKGDIAFTLSNLEITVAQPGRIRNEFVPVATLLPASELIGGESAIFTLLPFEERGPIIFSNREVFPNLVEDLMRAPSGLIFNVSYYDVTDEFGRNLAYITQDVFERTAVLTIDPGDGTFKRYYVATSGGLDSNNIMGGGLVGGFDSAGVAKGVPMDFVLQDILGLTKNPTEPNAIVAGHNGNADTVAQGDDVQAIPSGTTGLTDRSIVILAGENKILDTPPNNVTGELGDDEYAFTTGYQTSKTCNASTTARITEPEFGGDGIATTIAKGDDIQLIPARNCIGGEKAGALCEEDLECRETECNFSSFCAGGVNDGNTCGVNRDCLPRCETELCIGGTLDGNTCTEDTDCVEALCVPQTMCVGGDKDGDVCVELEDCLPYCEGEVCAGGHNDGESCTETADCLPDCVNDLCVGGALDDQACTEAADCITQTCAEVATCISGDRVGQLCKVDTDCFEGSCEILGFCSGGLNNGNACDAYRDCIPHCEENLCVGGEFDGVACDDDRTCIAYCDEGLCVGGFNADSICIEDLQCLPHCEDYICVGGDNDGDLCEGNEDCPYGICATSNAALPGETIISAGPNGLLESVPNGDDIYRGPGERCNPDVPEDCPSGSCSGQEVLVRYKNSITGDPKRFWVILSSEEIPIGSDFGKYLLKPDEAITLAFGQDIDRDGLFAREEYVYGSSDRDKNSDEDLIGDYAEIREGWVVTVFQPKTSPQHTHVYPNPTLTDSDFDGLDDHIELLCRTDPRQRDTDRDGLPDAVELGVCSKDYDLIHKADPVVPCAANDTIIEPFGGGTGLAESVALGDDVQVIEPGTLLTPGDVIILPGDNKILDSIPSGNDIAVSSECPDHHAVCVSILNEVCPPGTPDYPPTYLDPRNADTDGDSLPDGLELSLGSNPLDPTDADAYRDTDQDGLTDQEEREGWYVVLKLCEEPGCSCYGPDCICTTTNEPCDCPNGDCVPNAEGPKCRSGDNDGLSCSTDNACRGLSTCEEDAYCVGGPFEGNSCGNDRDCSPYCQNESCVGGENQGTPCSEDIDCTEGTCRTLQKCAGGFNNNNLCLDHRICNPHCEEGSCLSGIHDGLACVDDLDCYEGECASMNVCAGVDSPNVGETCLTSDQCYPVCDDNDLCSGGFNAGNPCTTDNDCRPTCDSSICVGGIYANAQCDSVADCIEASCQTVSACISGENTGNICTEHRECNPFCNGVICVGGTHDNEACTSDMDCVDIRCESMDQCNGGAFSGEDCTSDDDCQPFCNVDKCEGGIKHGEACSNDSDCMVSGVCESDIRGPICRGGPDDRQPCDCPGGKCEIEGSTCEGGLSDGERCDCPDGVCVDTAQAILVYPDPTEGDSDFDGLPDYVERELKTNPNDADTDGDGITDYDEFANFGAYMNLNNRYPGFYLSGAASLKLGTDPTSQDSDGDQLPDNFEQVGGWRVFAQGFEAPIHTYSDPLLYDSDLDGLNDLQEYLGANFLPPNMDGQHYDATDPSDPDTDEDGRLDGREIEVNTNPLQPDLFVKVTYTTLMLESSVSQSTPCNVNYNGQCMQIRHRWWYSWLIGPWWSDLGWRCIGGFRHWQACNPAHGHVDCQIPFLGPERPGWWWTLYVKKPGDLDVPDSAYDELGYWPWLDDDYPGTAVSHHCQWWWDDASRWWTHGGLCQSVSLFANELVPINKSVEFQLLPGQSFQLFVDVAQVKECENCWSFCLFPARPDQSTFYPGYVEKSCAMRDQQTYTFEDLIGAQGSRFKDFAISARDPDPNGTNTTSNCSGHVYAEIEVE